jgi:hypothetical protein
MLGRAQPLSASDDCRERGEGRRRWDPHAGNAADARLRTNFEISIQLARDLMIRPHNSNLGRMFVHRPVSGK